MQYVLGHFVEFGRWTCFPARDGVRSCSVKRPIHCQLNWAILLCDTVPERKTVQTAQFWQAIVQASELSFAVVFHTENCAVHSGNPTDSSVCLPTPRWHHLKAHPFLAIHSADEHRTIYSFSNTTSYSTFYRFLFFFWITLWPMWLANSKRQPCFYPPQSHAQEDTQNWKNKTKQNKTNKPDGKPVQDQRTFSSVFRAVFFYTVKLHSLI